MLIFAGTSMKRSRIRTMPTGLLRTLIIPADITDLLIILGIETLSFMMLVQSNGKNWFPVRSLGVFQRTFRKGVFKVTFYNTFVFRHVGVVSQQSERVSLFKVTETQEYPEFILHWHVQIKQTMRSNIQFRTSSINVHILLSNL